MSVCGFSLWVVSHELKPKILHEDMNQCDRYKSSEVTKNTRIRVVKLKWRKLLEHHP